MPIQLTVATPKNDRQLLGEIELIGQIKHISPQSQLKQLTWASCSILLCGSV